MTQPWFQVFADLPGHRKIGKLRDALGLKNRYEAVGLVICLWSWAAVHAPSGELDDISAQDLADAAGWRKSPKKFREGLISSGLVDQPEDGGLRLHDWDNCQGMMQDAHLRAKQKAAARQRAYRERRRAEREASQMPSPAPENNATRNVTRDVTGDISGDERDGPTSSSTITSTLPISKAVAVVNPVRSDSDCDDDTDSVEELDGWKELRRMGGTLGQGVLLLTGEQDADLMEKLGLEAYEHYCRRLVAWVQKTGAVVDHYRTILKWWREDTQIQTGPDILWGGGA